MADHEQERPSLTGCLVTVAVFVLWCFLTPGDWNGHPASWTSLDRVGKGLLFWIGFAILLAVTHGLLARIMGKRK